MRMPWRSDHQRAELVRGLGYGSGMEKLEDVMEPTFWRKNGWSARVIKNEDDDGWAVEIHQQGRSEPALISPWVMGRDKKNPKPFDAAAFATFVKTASEVIGRSESQHQAAMKRNLAIAWEGKWYDVVLELVADEYEPHAFLSAINDAKETVARHRVPSTYRLTRDGANDWVRGGFQAPGER